MVVTDDTAGGTERRSEAVLRLLLAVAGLGAATTSSSVCFNHSPGKNVAESDTHPALRNDSNTGYYYWQGRFERETRCRDLISSSIAQRQQHGLLSLVWRNLTTHHQEINFCKVSHILGSSVRAIPLWRSVALQSKNNRSDLKLFLGMSTPQWILPS